MADGTMEAEIIFEPHVPTALRRALEYAGDDGFVASLPQLLHARANAAYDNIIWNSWFTSNTEEADSDFYGYDSDYGIGGYACIHNMARYIAVAPHDVSMSLRNLDFGP